MLTADWLRSKSPAFRLMIATSWLAPDSWQEKQAEVICEAIENGVDWLEYLRLVDRHRIPALSLAALSRVPRIALPEDIRQELQKRSDDCRIEAVKQCLLLASVLNAFNRAGIRAMPLKGQLLSMELYGDVGLRQCRDIDLAVAQDDLDRALTCLRNIGWSLESPSWFPLNSRQWQRMLRFEHDLELFHPQTGGLIELHWRDEWETPTMTRARWDRSVSSVWQGCSIQVMNRDDLTLYLCNHGSHHAWARAKWLGDLARAHSSGQLDWDGAMRDALKTGQAAVLLVAIDLLSLLYGLPRPDLQGTARTHLPARLIDIPLGALTDAEEIAVVNSKGWLRYRLTMSRYERSLRPRKTWGASLSRLLYGREDFRTLPLPEYLTWLYAPLHPFLGFWRLATRAAHRNAPRARSTKTP